MISFHSGECQKKFIVVTRSMHCLFTVKGIELECLGLIEKIMNLVFLTLRVNLLVISQSVILAIFMFAILVSLSMQFP